jgi:hypothetical protein
MILWGKKVEKMAKNEEAIKLAGKYGLSIKKITWEDCARNVNSCWGPCISDMSLQVDGDLMPMIRQNNFEDLTWDVPMEKIPLIVGNEAEDPLYAINLKEYLKNIGSYISMPDSWKGNNKSLYCEGKDINVMMSSQACFLPVPKSMECNFNVGIMNYQSSPSNPSVLAIVATSNGTSAQLIAHDKYCSQKLFFNKNGKTASFIAQRLSDNRIEKGISEEGEITQKEKQENMVMIIQVPVNVKKAVTIRNRGYQKKGLNSKSSKSTNKHRLECDRESNIEHAIIKVGKEEGDFPTFNNLEIERNTDYPVRVTLQYYKATSNGVINNEDIESIFSQLKESRKYATAIGSLVVSDSNRTTEFKPQVTVAPWWNDWWIIHGGEYTHLTEQQAKEKIFKNGRFVDSSLFDVEHRLKLLLSPIKSAHFTGISFSNFGGGTTRQIDFSFDN